MATISYTEPTLIGSGNNKEPKIYQGPPAPGAAWRRGNILVLKTVESIVTPPAPAGSLATAPAPGAVGASAFTVTDVAATGAPAQTYYIGTTYYYSGGESAISAIIAHNCPAGYVPRVNVASSGAPSAATGYQTYGGLINGFLSLQNDSNTSLGSNYDFENPLDTSQGWDQAATNASSGIVGMAVSSSSENFFDGSGGSFNVGPGSRTGANTFIPPLAPFQSQGFEAIGLGNGQLIEMNLLNTTPWYPSLLSSTAGLTLDSVSGFHIVDPGQSNKILTIVDKRDGVYIGPTSGGTVGDFGVRVIVQFNSGLLLP